MRDVSLVEARQQIYQDLQNSGTTNYALGNWRKKKDRLALCHYLLTRELLEADVGSIAMFAIPPDMSLQRPRNEHFLHPLSETDLMHERKTSPDIVHAGVSLLRRKIGKLRAILLDGSVKVEVRHQGVSPVISLAGRGGGKASAVHHQIAAMRPSSISWSNVLDYMNIAVFHAMARACSAPAGTIHFGYSMNWPQNMKGASVFDYVHEPKKIDALCDVGQKTVVKGYKAERVEHLLLSPPVENAVNLGDLACHSAMYKKWADAFFASADLADPCRQVAAVQLKPFSVWSQSNTTVYLTWSYDECINLGA
uniref:Uncharacterized protein n=2 Tax=Tetraselmis chuii TaxID=63592 RepID=A0A7S1X5G0_9CHLO|mmetsp:Transcript_30386/g.54391  ORF Transcript_30386/g.54391 Transcript_30386/m.54391 type:complete len:309 (+) Transcript_30386:216-1142(+)